MNASRSPAGPTIIGSARLSTAVVATAASIAFPPCVRIRNPACAARGWLVTTMPLRAITSDRLCCSQPSARSPRSPLQNGGLTSALQVAAAASHCAEALTATTNRRTNAKAPRANATSVLALLRRLLVRRQWRRRRGARGEERTQDDQREATADI